MKNPRPQKLGANAMRELLKRVTHHLDPDLSREFMCSFYVLDDGGAALVEETGNGIHFYSSEELVSRYRTNVEHALEYPNALAELLPHAERFATDAQALGAKLPRLLGIDPDLLNLSEESLDAIDSAIRRLGSERILTPEVFPSLTAYVGEVIRRAVNGSWEVQTTTAGLPDELDIVDPAGGRYALLRIYKQLLEYGRMASMRTFVHVALRSSRKLPPE